MSDYSGHYEACNNQSQNLITTGDAIILTNATYGDRTDLLKTLVIMVSDFVTVKIHCAEV